MKRVYKFHEFNRRDESIINKIRTEDGTIIYEEEEVHRSLIHATDKTR